MGDTTRYRLSVTVTFAMRAALEDLADREASTVSAIATRLLRQSLDRTMQTEAVQRRVRAHVANRTRASWLNDTTTEHAVESDYAKAQAKQTEAGSAGEPAKALPRSRS